MSANAVTELVDALLNRAHQEHPGIEYHVVMAEETTLLLPVDSKALRREVDGQDGFYGGHVYRDVLIDGKQGLDEDLICAMPVQGNIPEAANASTYYGRLKTGQITTQPPP